MNDPQTSFFADSCSDNETIITAEIVESEILTAETAEIERINAENSRKIARLQQELAETKECLETGNRRLRSCETLLTRQKEELAYERGQLRRAIAEVESYRQRERSQQRAIATCSEELAKTREELAHIQRECTLLQEHYNEQVQRVLSAEQEAQELRSRLQRQQQSTLQYKTALEECTGLTVERTPATEGAIVPSPTSIEPWSSERSNPEELAIVAGTEEAIDEFLAEFERIDLTERSRRGRNDWPSPVILPYNPRYPAIKVDLPLFLKNRPELRSNDASDP
jgi:chromosome segregation ATPase